MSKRYSIINKNIINESDIWIEPRRFYIQFVAKKEISTYLVNTDIWKIYKIRKRAATKVFILQKKYSF
jgi:hypothetical protein